MAKPQIVLIHGAWHSGAAFDVLTPYLTACDYSVTALDLPSVGAEPPLTSLDPEITCIQAKLLTILEAGKDVVVVMHSYGGFAGSAALRGFSKADRKANGQPGGVTALVYMTAWLLDEGLTIRGSGGGKGGNAGPATLKEQGDYLWHLDPVPAFYHDVDPNIAEKYASRLKHHSLPTLYAAQPYAAWKYIPTTYQLCSEDRTIPYARQLQMVEDAEKTGAKVTTFTCTASHSPFLSQPELTSRVIRHAAGERIHVS